MEYRRLGKSGLQLSVLSLGSWLTFGKQVGDSVAESLMTMAYDNGVNFFDNAEIYARGKSEEVMGKILKKKQWRRDSYTVSSKAFFGLGGELLPTQKGLHRKHLVEACEGALQRLQLDYLDLFFATVLTSKPLLKKRSGPCTTLSHRGKSCIGAPASGAHRK